MRYIITITLLLACCGLLAQTVNSGAGEYGFQMLKINASPIGSALAGNWTQGDRFAFYTQPAATMLQEGRGLAAAQNMWLFKDNDLNSVAYTSNKGSWALAGGWRWLDYNEIEKRSENAEYLGTYKPTDVVFSLNAATRLTASQAVGVNAHLLYEKIDAASCYGFATDLGWHWQTPITGLNVQAATKNIGYTGTMRTKTVDLPWGVEAGAEKNFVLPGNQNAGVQLGAIKYADDFQTRLSGWWSWHNMFTLRAGFLPNSDLLGLTAGCGVNYGRFGVDYAWMSTQEDLDNVHVFGISYKIK